MTKPEGNFVEPALSVGGKIGRYFSITSVVPTLLLIAWITAILASGAPGHHPNVNHTRQVLADISVAGYGALLALAIFIALLLHPLQFATTQLLEGYWGSSTFAATVAAWRINRHRDRLRRLRWMAATEEHSWRKHANDVLDALARDDASPGAIPSRRSWPETRQLHVIDGLVGDPAIVHMYRSQLAGRAVAQYPRAGRVLPTRLGNALRRGEDSAGSQYGLDLMQIAPHLVLDLRASAGERGRSRVEPPVVQ